MNTKILGFILIVLGVLALAYGGFTYTESKNTAELGPVEISVAEKETVNIPIWAGIGAVVAGGLLLVIRRK